MKSLFNIAPAAIIATILLLIVFAAPKPQVRMPQPMTPESFSAAKQNQRGPAKQPNDMFMRQRTGPDGTLNMEGVRIAKAQAQALRTQPRELDELWTLEGPSNIGGRLTAVAIHPDHMNTVYAGAAIGGVFKSTDYVDTFYPVFEEDYAQSAGALAIDPNDPQKLWYGTGEANSSGDSYPGNGIYQTEDGGATWAYKGLPESYHIGRIVIDPQNTDRVFVAAVGKLFGYNPERGVYRTEDGGDTWDLVHFIDDSTGCIDIEINPNNPDTVFAVMWHRYRGPAHRQTGGPTSGVWRSIDGGDTWSQLTNGIPHDDDRLGRGALAISPSHPDRLYLVHSEINPGNPSQTTFRGFWRSDDGGDSWAEYDVDGLDYTLYSTFGWYFGDSMVDPVDPDILYVGGVAVIRTLDGGQSWNTVFGDAHVDHHGFWISPDNPQIVVTGHDGGINFSQNRGLSSTRFSYLPCTQFYEISYDPSQPERIYGGTQDNGTMRTPNGTVGGWEQIFGGDGFYSLVDPRDSDVIYASWQYGHVVRSFTGGGGWEYIYDAWSGDRTNWMTPFIFNPFDYDQLYVGTYRVYKTADQGNNWTIISPDLTNGDDPGSLVYGTISTIAASPVIEGYLAVGTDDGNVWISTNDGGDWLQVDSELPDMWVSRVVWHPELSDVLFVTYSGHRIGQPDPFVFRSDDLGQSWVPIHSNLPAGPINDVVVDPSDPQRLFVGTDFGVFVSHDYGGAWEVVGEGLPMSAVFDLDLVDSERMLLAGTHGRSIYSYDISIYDFAPETMAGIPVSEKLFVTNYPNPFNAETTIRVNLPEPGQVQVRIIDLLGRTVAEFGDESLERGVHEFNWSGATSSGIAVSSGMYLAVVQAGNQRAVRRLHLLK